MRCTSKADSEFSPLQMTMIVGKLLDQQWKRWQDSKVIDRENRDMQLVWKARLAENDQFDNICTTGYHPDNRLMRYM